MSLEGVFVQQYEDALRDAHGSHIQQALWVGAGNSAASAGGVMAQGVLLLALTQGRH